MVSLIMDLDNDVLNLVNNIRITKEKIVYKYVKTMYFNYINKNIKMIYYYLRFDNKNIYSYLTDKTKLIKIYKYKHNYNSLKKSNKFNFSNIKKFRLFNFYELVDDIVEKYNELIYNILDHIIYNKNIILEKININICPIFEILYKEEENIPDSNYQRIINNMEREHVKYCEILAVIFNVKYDLY